ncbi:fungal hydrophobin [Polyporus arcularius HHB13444]|uniref:Hydrophobin n=1 Tax=Polyporus arcularius HHB13444 TaxID=1314778 RepID=A0A5C3PDK6_9APHY|nr:fungal hydrophobin [Polyporus arcularius HHB13444]
MIFARLTAVLPVVLAATTVGASIVPRCDGSGSGSGSSDSGSAGSCNTGPVQCCNQTFDTKDHSPDLVAGLLGVVVGSLDGLLGTSCSPIVSGATCAGTTVCCEDNAHGGLVSIGCVPIVL